MKSARSLYLSLVLALAPSLATADLIYAHDVAGNGTAGTIEDLIEAVKQGRSISILYSVSDTTWVRACPSVSVVGGVVSCYVTDVLSTTNLDNTNGVFGAKTFESPRALEAHIYDTLGYRAVIKRDFFTGAELSVVLPAQGNLALRWYAD